MEIDWIILTGAAAILFLPATLLYPGPVKEQLAQSRSARFRIEHMLGAWQHWLDFGRAFGGAFLLVNAAVTAVPAEADESFYGDAILTVGILVAAVLFQTIHYKKYFYFTAPVFFLWGMAFALVDWIPVVFAVVFSAVLARLADHVELKLPLMAGLLAVAGYLVNGFSLNLVLSAALIVLPVIVALGSMQHLVCYSRG